MAGDSATAGPGTAAAPATGAAGGAAQNGAAIKPATRLTRDTTVSITAFTLSDDGKALIYVYEAQGEHRGVTRLIEELFRNNIRLRDIATIQSSLEDIFVGLVSERKPQ